MHGDVTVNVRALRQRSQEKNELWQCLHARSVSLCYAAVEATVQPTSDVHFSSGVISSVGQLIDYETNPLRQLLMR